MTVKTNPEARKKIGRPIQRIMSVMHDGKPRTVRQVHEELNMTYRTSTSIAMNVLVEDGILEFCGLTESSKFGKAREYRLVQKKEEPVEPAGPVITDNPFIWQTYEQYQPEKA